MIFGLLDPFQDAPDRFFPHFAGQTGIMLGADCTVPTDIDDTRLEWVRQAAVKYAETH